MDDPIPWLAIARATSLHAGRLASTGVRRPTELLHESRAALAALGLGGRAIESLAAPDAAAIAADARWLSGPDRRLVTWGSPDYPALLATIPDAPLVLFVEGNPAALSLPQLAIVGSRDPTPLGRDTAAWFARQLVGAGFAITSGLARGIDAAGHRGALQAGGRTVAVLGNGLDRIYPCSNAGLAREIVAGGGALVTDLPCGAPPLQQHFPRRNRIISGLSVGTLVIEAALRSGSLITARLAGDQGREVFAVPGSIHNPMARGCHRLIRQGAKLVENTDDIFAEIGAQIDGLRQFARTEAVDAQEVFGRALDKDQEILLDALGFAPASIDSLVARTGFAADAVASMLLVLELEGRVAQQHGGLYCPRRPGKV